MYNNVHSWMFALVAIICVCLSVASTVSYSYVFDVKDTTSGQIIIMPAPTTPPVKIISLKSPSPKSLSFPTADFDLYNGTVWQYVPFTANYVYTNVSQNQEYSVGLIYYDKSTTMYKTSALLAVLDKPTNVCTSPDGLRLYVCCNNQQIQTFVVDVNSLTALPSIISPLFFQDSFSTSQTQIKSNVVRTSEEIASGVPGTYSLGIWIPSTAYYPYAPAINFFEENTSKSYNHTATIECCDLDIDASIVISSTSRFLYAQNTCIVFGVIPPVLTSDDYNCFLIFTKHGLVKNWEFTQFIQMKSRETVKSLNLNDSGTSFYVLTSDAKFMCVYSQHASGMWFQQYNIDVSSIFAAQNVSLVRQVFSLNSSQDAVLFSSDTTIDVCVINVSATATQAKQEPSFLSFQTAKLPSRGKYVAQLAPKILSTSFQLTQFFVIDSQNSTNREDGVGVQYQMPVI